MAGLRTFRHHAFNEANDRHDNAAANAPAHYAADDALQVQSTAGSTGAEHRLKNLPAENAAPDAGQGIPHRPQTDVLKNGAGQIATDRPADELDNKCNNVHRLSV